MKKVLLSHALYEPGMKELREKVQVFIQKDHTPAGLAEELRETDAYILRIGSIDKTAIEAGENLKVITRPGVGVDNVDVNAATRKGIPVVICPAFNARAVAEHTLAILLALSKDLPRSIMENRKGNFNVRNSYRSVDIIGKTVSVLGAGKIGMEFARLCKSIGLEVIVYDPYVENHIIEQSGFKPADHLYEALEAGDYVSLHMPLTEQTKGLIGFEELRAMKKSSFLINCARGGLLKENDLFNALKNKEIAGAGLDVMEEEPTDTGNPLFELDNVIITPHMAAQTRETTEKVVKMAVEGTLAVLNGIQWPHVCNPEVYQHERWKN